MPLITNEAPQLMKKEASLLELPEAILDNILERLSPIELCSMSEVCTCLIGRCRSNVLWEKHVQRRWGRLLGDVAYREWQFHVMRIMNKESPSLQRNPEGLLGSFTGAWPFLCLCSYLENPGDLASLLLSNYSNMALYVSLQRGRFWFPAQVYRMTPFQLPRRYNGLLSYEHVSNTFQARCPTDEWRLIEKNITWDRLRLPPIHTSPYTLYVSNNNDLKPGDHVEVQMRKGSRTYDWCYGVIDHLESCDKDMNNHCSCEHSEMLVVSFKLQYSQWKSIAIKKEANGEQKIGLWKIGGIRKLEDLEDIRRWNTEHHMQISSLSYYV
ncbi:F-box protein At2g26850-like [Prosopis cineraria]|uniref:F-box protein At2g26850-like n=1 Tax=Prosopis cineraria TaxID=364024 RepID=UPI00240F5BCF|nr:F-box protein At2g26850-like [Prosopis cineraria]